MSPLRQRVHNLRRRLIAACVALFIALFGGITVQLASGHDPALKSSSATATSSTPSSSAAAPPPSPAPVSPTPADGQQSSTPTQLAPVTTSQS